MLMITDAASGAALKAEAAASAAANEGQEPSLVRAPVKHVLSKELQLYFDRVARILRGKPGQPYFVHATIVHVLLQEFHLCVRTCAFVCSVLQCFIWIYGQISVLAYCQVSSVLGLVNVCQTLPSILYGCMYTTIYAFFH